MLKENALGTVPGFTWNYWGKFRGTLLGKDGIWTESFVLYRHLEYLRGYGRLIKMNLPRNRMRVAGL